VFTEENFEPVEFLWDAFDVIESIDTDDYFLPLEFFFKLSDTGSAFSIFECLSLAQIARTYVSEFFRVNADGDSPHMDTSSFVRDGIGHRL
jgi:hypothetical protein